MDIKKFDAIIIGTGQAGPPLAASLAKNGLSTLIIEKAHLGGTCVNVGCTPTKAYVASARRAFIAKNSSNLGIEIEGKVEVNLKTIKARKDKIIQDSRDGLNKMLTETEGITLLKGTAKFKDANTVEVDGKTFTADKFYINVGGRARIPEGFKEVNCLTNTSILELEEIPEHLIIVGGGYIGLEFGQMFRRFGSKVTILESGDQLLKREDNDIAEGIAEIFKNEDIDIRLNAECISAKNVGDQIEVNINCTEGSPSIIGSHLLIATGRIPNTDSLNLEKIGVKMDKRGYIKVNNELQSNLPHIWALGDCNGQGAFTHTAYNDFQIVNSHLFQENKRMLSDRFMCYAAFIDPPIARVGLNEKEIKEKGLKAKVATRAMSKIARAKEMGETQGKLKIFIEEKTEKILGATFLGTGADEYIHSIIDLMYADAPYTVIRDAVHIHPTVSELIPTMLENPKPIN
ncbi:pyruvate/2-oxoglutarate dehydrogenase complex dihydrolipoamide dehydrogenase (E3) component [Gillisia sp. Hel_I_86]|uniref:FAD-containing oxidoreductase n=1 Tax=Gillisia sp. Hel_I_86 TaxID=1249981 RepID=UPI001199B1AE|nr:FAD-containing oxidoreductase [Gillisia sp. Hel_I_86]TVZ26143.1 pyruvate/2-oxoglutarate dehydrogenase complex dihydrolipoamide dehydrogenase (E3) component [Gillisia sp. Hel_I_86]